MDNKKEIGFDWKAHHESLERRESTPTACRNITGKDFHTWAEFSRNSGEKLKQLTDSLIIDLRLSRTLSFEEEKNIYLAYDALNNVIKSCETQEEIDLLDEKNRKERVEYRSPLSDRKI